LFTSIHAKVILEGNKVHVTNVETNSNGIYFAGNVDIDYSLPDEDLFTVEIFADAFHGKVSQVQHFFSHFKPSGINKPLFFLRLPLEGNIISSGKGAYVRFDCEPKGFEVQTLVTGSLSEGKVRGQGTDVGIHDLCLDFEYNQKENFFNFTDIQGTVLVGKPDRAEEYLLTGDGIRFFDYANNGATFDFWVEDKGRDILRLAGTTQSPFQHQKELIEILFNNQLTHFGNVHPTTADLVLQDWDSVESFDFKFQLDLDPFFQDLQKFSRTGLFFLTKRLLASLNEIKNAHGTVNAYLKYQNNGLTFDFGAEGDSLSFDDHHFDKCTIKGKKQGKIWSIDSFQMDDISASAEFQHAQDDWKINFLGLRFSNSLLLGLNGDFHQDTQRFQGNLQLFETNLQELHEWEVLRPLIDTFALKGIVKGTGTLDIELFDSSQWYRIRSSLIAKMQSLDFLGLHFQDCENIAIQYTTEEGMLIKNIATHLIEKDGFQRTKLQIPCLKIDTDDNYFALEKVHFVTDIDNLPWLSQTLNQQFPEYFTETFSKWIQKSKQHEPLEGYFTLKKERGALALQLQLADGTYSFGEQSLHLSKVEIDCQQNGFNFSAYSQFRQRPFWISGKTTSLLCDTGEVIFLDQNPSMKKPLTIHWSLHPLYGLQIKKATGYFSGIEMQLSTPEALTNSNSPWNILTGTIHLDLPEVCHLTPPKITEKMAQWKIGKGYSLIGTWWIDPKAIPFDFANVYFQGMLNGTNFEIKGFRLDSLIAEIDYSPTQVAVKNIQVQDLAGTLNIPELLFNKNSEEYWEMSLPELAVRNLRPSILQLVGRPARGSPKPLVIKRFDLAQCRGILDVPDSFKGNGNLYFVNPSRRNLQNTIFAIPAEILLRVGLDLNVLNPGFGTVFFEIKGDRFFLTRFKDMYSDGRASKFYLTKNSPEESWVDFDGNLHLQVRMKQYNLVFKLAELFTVTVQGTLRKPLYTLQKQPLPQHTKVGFGHILRKSF
jgi:hypothetical protein